MARTGSHAGPDVDFFNESENIAQRMLWKATRSYALADARSATLVVVGTGVLAEALIVQAARQWLGRGDRNEQHGLSVHLFADDADSEARRICALWPEVGVACSIEAHTAPPETASRYETPADAAFVVIENPERSSAIVFRLVDETEIPCIVVTVDGRARRLFGSDRVLTFDPIADGLESDELLFDSYDLMARMAYIRTISNSTHRFPRVLIPRTRRTSGATSTSSGGPRTVTRCGSS